MSVSVALATAGGCCGTHARPPAVLVAFSRDSRYPVLLCVLPSLCSRCLEPALSLAVIGIRKMLLVLLLHCCCTAQQQTVHASPKYIHVRCLPLRGLLRNPAFSALTYHTGMINTVLLAVRASVPQRRSCSSSSRGTMAESGRTLPYVIVHGYVVSWLSCQANSFRNGRHPHQGVWSRNQRVCSSMKHARFRTLSARRALARSGDRCRSASSSSSLLG